MKKIIIMLFVLSVALCGCSVQGDTHSKRNDDSIYVKSVWLAYYELQNFTKGKGESEFKKGISQAFEKIHKSGFNTVTVQVRPCADSFYPSAYFPTSVYFNGTQGEEMTYDPLEIMCSLADKYKLRIEAWINPYRVSQDNDFSKLCDNNIALVWHNSEDKSDYVKECDGKLYFNPAYKEVTDLIVNGVKEIVEGYSVDGIHFDDYFYPTSDSEFDSVSYDTYSKQGGELSLPDWRRNNVSCLIKEVYKTIKQINPEIKFGVSPASDIKNDYSNLYADIEKWVCEDGYVDYICPQIYFGFRNVKQPFMITVKKWRDLLRDSDVELYVGLPLYKCNKIDDYAASEDEEIKNEFVDNDDIISRQITYLTKIEKIKGYYIFSYSYLIDEELQDEVSLMLEAMQSSNPLLRQPFL